MSSVLVVHGGAGARAADLGERPDEYEAALREALERGRRALEDGGAALDAVQAAVAVLEDCELFNAGRGAALCSDGSVELSAAVMRGSDQAVGAVAGVHRARNPVLAARAVLDSSPHVLIAGPAADDYAAGAGIEQCEPEYFITERQRRGLHELGSRFEGGTVGAVCLDRSGELAAATSTGGIRGQAPGRVGDSPLPGAGTWADPRVAVSCTGHGEMFIRAGAARGLAELVRAGTPVKHAADMALAEVAELGGEGGLIAVDSSGRVALPYRAAAMPRGLWRSGGSRQVWL